SPGPAGPGPAVALGKEPGGPPRARPAPRRTDAILGVAPDEPPRPPLEAGESAGTGTRSLSGGPSTAELSGPKPGEARGHLCSRGHLNDPRSHFCVLCGIRMNERTGVLVIGSRPPLGLLVFDDGATYTVDAEYLVGRMPESDERVRSGGLRSIVVEDRSGAVSRVHAEVRVDNWDVVLVDSGSRNGTFVASPGDPAWTPVPPGRSHRLEPGMRVRLGGRTFVFESPSGVR
ncbi:FHA domain-containing protein, partial [Pseudonocardia hydrocarbonoxydans]